jgi:hypothetical protein
MPIKEVNWSLLREAVTAAQSQAEQCARAGVTPEQGRLVYEATEQALLGNKAPFELNPELSAAASRLLATSSYVDGKEGKHLLKVLLKLTGQSLSKLPDLPGPAQRIFSAEFRIRGLLHESPEAFLALVLRSQSPYQLIDPHPTLPGKPVFSNRGFLKSFGLFRGEVSSIVQHHLLDAENLLRFDELTRAATSGPQRPEGVSIKEGIQVLFQQGPVYPHSAIITAIRYAPGGESRPPGSGIHHAVILGQCLKGSLEYVSPAYADFRDGKSQVGYLKTGLGFYFAYALGRNPSPEEIGDRLQKDRPGFPLRAALIQALEVREQEFDEVMERAASEGIFREAREARREDTRTAGGRRKISRGK